MMNSRESGRVAPLDLSAEEFRTLGHGLVDRIAEFLGSLRDRPVSRSPPPREIRALLGTDELPERGADAAGLLGQAADVLFEHSLHNGHPRFLGYITSSAAPLGALADLLAAAVNPNVGGWDLSPVASEIERQTIRWIADLVGYPAKCGGLLVSGGNMANITAFFAARKAKAPWAIRETGLYADGRPLTLYASAATHTWVQKAADLSGLGTNNIRWIGTDEHERLDVSALAARLAEDRSAGCLPFLVVGTAGSVRTGAVDPLPAIASLCEEQDLWFHVDGAYGAPAAGLPSASSDLRGLARADSLALDPHKWLYAPLEAGCTLVRNPESLTAAFSFHPDYYKFTEEESDPRINYYEYGLQNSRGFRALKVWLALRNVGREGYLRMIQDDIDLAAELYEVAEEHPELETGTRGLSITSFRYRPGNLDTATREAEEYLDVLNTELLARLQAGGEAFVSNVVLNGRFFLRCCIVNFRTTRDDVHAIPEIVARLGRAVDAELRPAGLAS